MQYPCCNLAVTERITEQAALRSLQIRARVPGSQKFVFEIHRSDRVNPVPIRQTLPSHQQAQLQYYLVALNEILNIEYYFILRD